MTTADSKQLHTLLPLHQGKPYILSEKRTWDTSGVNIYQIKRCYVLKAMIVNSYHCENLISQRGYGCSRTRLRRILVAMGEELKRRREHCTIRIFVRSSIPHIATEIQTMHTEVQVGKPEGRGTTRYN
jgi:hypothetical protein